MAISSDLQRGQEWWLTNQLSTHAPQPSTCLQQLATDIGDVINARQIRHSKTLLTTSASWVFRNDRSTTIPQSTDTPTLSCNWISLQSTTHTNFPWLHVADHGCYLSKAKIILTQCSKYNIWQMINIFMILRVCVSVNTIRVRDSKSLINS